MMNTTGTANVNATGLTQQDAATEIASLLSVDDGTQAGSEGEDGNDGEEATAVVEAGDGEEGSEADPDNEPESEDEEEVEDDGEEVPELPDDAKVKVGDEEVTLHELKRGFLREQDYTRKTMALAEERKAHTATSKAELDNLRNERAAYVQGLGEVQQFLAQLKPQEPDWNELYQTDPAQYAAQREMWRSYNDQQVQIEAARKQAILQSNEDIQRELSAFVTEEKAKLLEKLPEWSKPEVANNEKARIARWGEANGFSAEEMANLSDHRAVITARKAMLYDELMAKHKAAKPVPVKQGQPKTAKPGNAATAPNRNTEATRARQRLAKTGKVGDAAAAILAFLPDE